MTATLRRVLTIVVAALLFLVLVGATYQGVATALERRQHPHTGSLIKAGRHQLHIHCTGDGSPTVVLEAPATGMSASWAWVQPQVAEETRVCSYDRAGLGWSEWGPTAFDPQAVPVQLRTLLGNAKEKGPFVFVGEGFGAALARLTAARYPADTAALVQIDPPSSVIEQAQLRRMARTATASPWLARTGVLRLSRALSGVSVELPGESAGALATFLARPDHLTRSARELALWNETIALAAAASLPADLPVTDVQVADADTDGAAMLTTRAGGEQVVQAILEVVNRLRER